LYLQTFGRLAVTAEGQPLAGAASQPRRLALLAMLACAGERGLTRDKLLAFFWPDADEERGRRGLSQAVYALRQDLGNEEVIVGSKDLRINADVMRSDVTEFAAAGSGGQWERAAGLYAGPFLDGFHLPSAPEFERWAEEQRVGFAREYTEALERLARAATGRSEHLAAVGWWRKLAAQDPLNARVATGLMQALVASGDRNGAIQHARIYEALVEQELNLPPDREVVALAERIRTEPAPASAAPAPRAPGAAAAPAAAVEPPPPTAEPLPVAPPAAVTMAAAEPRPAVEPGVRSTLPVSLREAASRFLQYHPSGKVKTTAEWLAVLAGQRGARPGPWWRNRATWIGAAVAVVLAGAAVALLLGRRGDTLVPGATQRVAFDGALELDPAISPDGKIVAYASDVGGEMRLYVRQGAAGRPVPITQSVPGYHRWPRWSPDGSRIVFNAERSIYVVPAFGGTAQPLVRSPGAGWVAHPAWSPDGRELAYVQNDTMFATDLASGARRMITDTAGFSPAWSPDGEWIAFASGNAAFVFGATSYGSPLNLGNVAPSSIWVVPATGGAPVRVTDDAALNVSPAWLPDGGGLLFVSDRNGNRDIYRVRLDPAGRPATPEQLTTGLDAQTITVAADGRRLAYSVFHYSANVWAADAAGDRPVSVSEARPLTSGAQIIEGLALSPDGAWLAYDTDLNGNQDIYKMPLAGGEAVQLTSDPRNDFVSGWSGNGRELAFYSFRRGTRRVQVMPADGGRSVEVAETPSNQRSPDWSPDGRMLAFGAGEPGEHQIYVASRGADSAWAAPRPITSRPGGGAGSPRWAPDGRQIAFRDDEGIWLVSPDGGEPRPLVRYGGPNESKAEVLQWSRDGRTLYYKAFDPSGRSVIAAVPAAGGAVREIIRFDDPLRQSTRPEFATDGQRFLFTIGTRVSDVWEMTLDRR